MDGTEPGGVYSFRMQFTLENFPGTVTWESTAEIATTTVTRGCMNIDEGDMDITCDGATDLQFYVPVGAEQIEFYLNSCTFNSDLDGVCSDDAEDHKFFMIEVYKDESLVEDTTWGFYEDIDGDKNYMDTWFSTSLTPGDANYPVYEWQGPHMIGTVDDADKGVYVFTSTYKRRYYIPFEKTFALDDPLTATVTIRDLCYQPGAELRDSTAYDTYSFDGGVFDISDLLNDSDATMEMELPVYRNSDLVDYRDVNGDAYNPADCGYPTWSVT